MSPFSPTAAKWIIDAAYILVAFLFITGLKRMSSPSTARGGILWAGLGMVIATLVTFLAPAIGGAPNPDAATNLALVMGAIVIGGALAWWSGKRVAMTDMPQMIALYNGMGGGAAAAIAGVELFRGDAHSLSAMTLAVIGGLIGSVSFSGSLIAFGKLQGLIKRSLRFSGQQLLNVLILAAAIIQFVFRL